jgi:hypothetical protein
MEPSRMRWELLCFLIVAPFLSSSSMAFDYFEHRYLGIAAYRKALDEYKASHPDSPLPAALEAVGKERLAFGYWPDDAVIYGSSQKKLPLTARSLKQLPLRFGDLSALAGDYTRGVEDLKDVIDEIRNPDTFTSVVTQESARAAALVIDTRRQWFSACKWLFRDRKLSEPSDPDWEKCFDSIGAGSFDAEPRHTYGAEGYLASREELAEHEAISGYITLASQNKTHFPRHSWKEYSKHHRQALRLAEQYRSSRCPASKPCEELLADILLTEGFAQHFLQDSFASGHIGTAQGQCDFYFLCRPTRQRILQTHNVLNEIGIDVAISDPADLRIGEKTAARLRDGWTAFGDDHLFIAAADFHRAAVIYTAAESIKEILGAISDGGSSSCRMCTATIFPIPMDTTLLSEDLPIGKTDLNDDYLAGDLVKFAVEEFAGDSRSPDPRVPRIPVEGWKIGLGIAQQGLGSNESPDHGVLIRLDYARDFGPQLPNVFGLEYWNIANLRSSYLFSVGYVRPREVSPASLAVRLKAGWRIEENLTPTNPTSDRHNALEITFPSFEATYELFKPAALFLQWNPYTFLHSRSGNATESVSNKKDSLVIGLRFDISGI